MFPALLATLACGAALHAQQGAETVAAQNAAAASGCPVTPAENASSDAAVAPNAGPPVPAGKSAAPVCLTLQDALARARKYNPQFQNIVTDAAVAHQDTRQSLAGLLPTVTYNNQFIYTQPNQLMNGTVRFIANNSVHEYISQGNFHEAIGVAEIADFRRVSAAAAVAKAKLDIATRGLVVTVVQLYYSLAEPRPKFWPRSKTPIKASSF